MQCFPVARWVGMVRLWPATGHMEIFQNCWCSLYSHTFQKVYSHIFSKITRVDSTTERPGTQSRPCGSLLFRTR